MKRQETDWEVIFIVHISDKEFVSRIYKQVIQPRKKEDLMGERLEQISQRRYSDGQQAIGDDIL